MASLLAALFGGGSQQSSPSRARDRPPSPRAPSYSFAQLQQLYSRLSQFRESDLERGAGDAVVETVRQITEALIWGEQNDTNFFDFFCEKSILSDFIRVLGLLRAPKKVKVQLLQTLSILVQNIRRQTSVYYLLSNNYVNKLITIPLDFNDEEILAYYITLLKSLAMRLDNETIKFFFIQHPDVSFPLYIEATKFFSHRDQMVRAAVRTITLQVYRIEDKAMHRFVLRHAKETYFSQLAYHLRDLWARLNSAAQSAAEEDLAALQHRNELQQDLLIYLSDVFELQVADINEVLADRLLNGVMLPVLLTSISRGTYTSGQPTSNGPMPIASSAGTSAGQTPEGDAVDGQPPLLTPAVALFLLRQVFDTFQCAELIEPIATLMLQPRVQVSLVYAMPQWPEPVPGDVTAESDLVPNLLRDQFLRCLSSREGSVFLLAASVVHACVCRSRVLSTSFLETAKILPASVDEKSSSGVDSVPTPVPNERKGFQWPSRRSKQGKQSQTELTEAPCGDNDTSIEILLLLLQGLHRHSVLQLDTFQVFMHILLDVFLDPAVCHHSKCRVSCMDNIRSALRNSAQVARHLLHSCLQGQSAANDGGAGGPGRPSNAPADDSLLDLLSEEWELHIATLVSVSDVCSNPRCILPVLPSGVQGVTAMRRSSPGSGSERSGQKAIRSFLLLRRLLADMARYAPQVPQERNSTSLRAGTVPKWAKPFEECSPLEVVEEAAWPYSEDMSLEFGQTDRVVCSIATPQGKHTRYLLLHDYWLLLVQPDLTTPGWAVVKTQWPIRSVQSWIDRSDPRTLRVGMYALRGAASHGEANVYRHSEPGFTPIGERPSSFLTLSLSFEDVKKCHLVDKHLQKRRREVRAIVLQQAIAFLDKYCVEQLPDTPTIQV